MTLEIQKMLNYKPTLSIHKVAYLSATNSLSETVYRRISDGLMGLQFVTSMYLTLSDKVSKLEHISHKN